MSDTQTVARFGTPLTEAERRVIEAMRDADSEADAAQRLGISRHTVHGHLANARSRFGVRTTRQLLMKLGA